MGKAREYIKHLFIKYQLRWFKTWADKTKLHSKKPTLYRTYKTIIENGHSLNSIKDIDSDINKFYFNLGYLPTNIAAYTDARILHNDISNIFGKLYYIRKSLFQKEFQKLTVQERSRFLNLKTEKQIRKMSKSLKISKIEKFFKDDGFEYNNPNVRIKSWLLKGIENDKSIKLVYNEGNAVIVRVKKRKAIRNWGCKKWCIKHKDEWKEYTKRGRKQFIVYDFDYHTSDNYHMVGITMNKKLSKVMYAYDNKNEEVFDYTDDGSYRKWKVVDFCGKSFGNKFHDWYKEIKG